MAASTRLGHVNNVAECGQDDGFEVGLVTTEVHLALTDTLPAVQVGVRVDGHQRVAAPVHASGTVLQMPVGIGGAVGVTRNEGRLHEFGSEDTAYRFRIKGNIALAKIPAFHG